MVVATVDDEGRPVTRSVLCKSVDETGITFYTNYDSAKGEELAGDAVRVGDVPLVRARPAGARARPGHQGRPPRRPPTTGPSARAARSWARGRRTSRSPIASRAALLDQLADVTARFADSRERPGAAELGRLPDRPRGRRVLAGPGEPGAQPDSGDAGGPHRAAPAVSGGPCGSSPTPHRCGRRDFRRLWLAGHRHGHRREPDHLRGPGAAVRADPELRLRRAVRCVRTRAAGGVRAVGRRVGRRDGPAHAADHRVVRAGGGVGAAVAAGRAGAEQRLGGAVPAVGAAGVLRDQLSRPASAAIPRMLPGEQLPAANSLNMTVMQFGAIVGPLLAGRDAALGRSVDAVSDRRDHVHRADLGDGPACADAAHARRRTAGHPGGALRAVLDGFRYLAGNTVVLMSFVVDLIAMIFGMPRALFPQMAHESFGGPVEGGTTMALLAAAMSVGAVAGGVFSGWLPRVRRQGLAVVVAIVVWGVAMVGFGVARRVGATARPGRCSGSRWCSWRLAARPTWCRRRSGRRSCSRRPPTTFAAGCRGCSPWSSRAAAAGRRRARRRRGRRRHHRGRGRRRGAGRGRGGRRRTAGARVRAVPGRHRRDEQISGHTPDDDKV